MRISIVLLTTTGLLMGCGSKNTTSTAPSPRSGTVVVVSSNKPAKKQPDHVIEKKAEKAEKKAEKNEAKAEKKAEKASDKSEKASGKPAHAANHGPRKLNVPPGHYPPEGMCRVWFEGRAPGQQPKPTDCNKLRGKVPAGAFVMYGGKSYDADYDWSREKRSVPEPLITILITR